MEMLKLMQGARRYAALGDYTESLRLYEDWIKTLNNEMRRDGTGDGSWDTAKDALLVEMQTVRNLQAAIAGIAAVRTIF